MASNAAEQLGRCRTRTRDAATVGPMLLPPRRPKVLTTWTGKISRVSYPRAGGQAWLPER